jgi:two-component system sensor histidine kinase KdpD
MIPLPQRAKQISDLPTPVAYLLTLVLSSTTCAALLAFNGLIPINKTTVALIFLLPVGLSATFWGLLPGILAAITCFLTFNYFFIEPIGTFTVHDSEDLVILTAFLGVTVVISQMVGVIKRNLAAATHHEEEALRLYEFNAVLANSQNEQSIARILLEKLDQTLHLKRIEVLIETTPKPILLSKEHPTAVASIPLPQMMVEPLQSTRGLIGEIRTWQAGIVNNSTEQRLLKIFANQSALAIERLRLAEAASKTRVIEESDRLKSSLLSSVSHELRSPLAAIKASVSSLRSGDVAWEDEARTELLTTVEEEIDYLNILVGNLLDMSRIEAGALKSQKTPNALNEIVSTTRGRMRLMIQMHQLEIHIPDDLPLVEVDFGQIQQVFTNLITNSVKYSPPNSTIRISANRKDEHFLQVQLTNQSMPIPEGDLERIFDKFYRIDPSERITGSGLGLSICKGIIEAHGGRIWAENIPGGLSFYFTLPLLQP